MSDEEKDARLRDCLTLDELIKRLELMRARHGGDTPVWTTGEGPVLCLSYFPPDEEHDYNFVVLSDRYAPAEMADEDLP